MRRNWIQAISSTGTAPSTSRNKGAAAAGGARVYPAWGARRLIETIADLHLSAEPAEHRAFLVGAENGRS